MLGNKKIRLLIFACVFTLLLNAAFSYVADRWTFATIMNGQECLPWKYWVTEKKEKESQMRIADLGQRLNVALAQRVQELSRYRSDFFGKLREILGNRPDIRVVGDRFVFQSEVFFDSGAAVLRPEGRAELDKLASALLDLEKQIPSEINWVLRVDGHTDTRPVSSLSAFKSNWELSAARAISVVQYLIAKGVPPQRLVAAGFGEFQPIDPGTTDEAFSRNRRIELKLTER